MDQVLDARRRRETTKRKSNNEDLFLLSQQQQILFSRRISSDDDDDKGGDDDGFPSKASFTKRSAIKPVVCRSQMWSSATIKVICAILLLLVAAAQGIDPQNRIRREVLNGELEDEGICPMKCACLDSYIQCVKVNLAIAPSRIPKWVESL